MLVVEGASSGTVGERAERPLIEGVVETSVADAAGQDGAFLARGHVSVKRLGPGRNFPHREESMVNSIVAELLWDTCNIDFNSDRQDRRCLGYVGLRSRQPSGS